MSPPSYCSTIRGFTSLPEQSGEVSIWAIKPIVGTSRSVFAGNVAYKYPCSSNDTSSSPIAFNSFSKYRANTICLSVLGQPSPSSFDCVSKLTYFKNRSISSIIHHSFNLSCKINQSYSFSQQRTAFLSFFYVIKHDKVVLFKIIPFIFCKRTLLLYI